MRYIVALLILGLLLQSCKPTDESSAPEQGKSQTPPLAIVVERELRGAVLGLPLSAPVGVAVSRDKQIFLSDGGNNRVLLLDSLLTPIQQRGGYGAGAGQLNHPMYLTLDNSLNLLVAEQGNRRISIFNTRLDYVSDIAMSSQDDPLKFGAPSGVAVRHGGEVWVSEPDNNRLDVFSYAGVFENFSAEYSAGMEGVLNPGKVMLAPSGNLLMVADPGNRRIVFLDDFGTNRKQIRYREFDHPIAVAASADFTWVIDEHTNLVHLFSNEGSYLSTYGPSLSGNGISLRNPTDVALLGTDHLLIVDSGNDRLLLCRIYWSQDDTDHATAQ